MIVLIENIVLITIIWTVFYKTARNILGHIDRACRILSPQEDNNIKLIIKRELKPFVVTKRGVLNISFFFISLFFIIISIPDQKAMLNILHIMATEHKVLAIAIVIMIYYLYTRIKNLTKKSPYQFSLMSPMI